jgi:hypothetical protein
MDDRKPCSCGGQLVYDGLFVEGYRRFSGVTSFCYAFVSVTVIVLSRLVYRKGADFLGVIIPEICSRHRNVNFVIGTHLFSSCKSGLFVGLIAVTYVLAAY